MTAYAWLEKFLIIQLTHIPRVTHLVPTVTLLATKAAPIVWKFQKDVKIVCYNYFRELNLDSVFE